VTRTSNAPFAFWAALAALVSNAVVQVSVAYAQAPVAPPQPPGFLDLIGKMLPMFVMVFFVFYIMVIRPQQSKIREHQKLIESLKRGDTVVTSGGLIGRVAGIEKDHVLIEFSSGVKVKVEPAHVAKRQEKEAESKNAA
jgi:preprotein translocase subunit YajC